MISRNRFREIMIYCGLDNYSIDVYYADYNIYKSTYRLKQLNNIFNLENKLLETFLKKLDK